MILMCLQPGFKSTCFRAMVDNKYTLKYSMRLREITFVLSYSFLTHPVCCSVFSVSLGGDKTLHLRCTVSNLILLGISLSFFCSKL